jgi:hypothetical protein
MFACRGVGGKARDFLSAKDAKDAKDAKKRKTSDFFFAYFAP